MGTGRIFHSFEERERVTGKPHPFRQPVIIYGMQRPVPLKKEPNREKQTVAAPDPTAPDDTSNASKSSSDDGRCN